MRDRRLGDAWFVVSVRDNCRRRDPAAGVVAIDGMVICVAVRNESKFGRPVAASF